MTPDAVPPMPPMPARASAPALPVQAPAVVPSEVDEPAVVGDVVTGAPEVEVPEVQGDAPAAETEAGEGGDAPAVDLSGFDVDAEPEAEVQDEADPAPQAAPAAADVAPSAEGRSLVVLDGGQIRHADADIVFVDVADLSGASAEALLALLHDLKGVRESAARTDLADEVTQALRRQIGV